MLSVYSELLKFKVSPYGEEGVGAYNTQHTLFRGSTSIKVFRLKNAVASLFPEVEASFYPHVPRRLEKHLTRNELVARIVAASLDGDAARIREVGELLVALSDGRLPALDDLKEWLPPVR